MDKEVARTFAVGLHDLLLAHKDQWPADTQAAVQELRDALVSDDGVSDHFCNTLKAVYATVGPINDEATYLSLAASISHASGFAGNAYSSACTHAFATTSQTPLTSDTLENLARASAKAARSNATYAASRAKSVLPESEHAAVDRLLASVL